MRVSLYSDYELMSIKRDAVRKSPRPLESSRVPISAARKHHRRHDDLLHPLPERQAVVVVVVALKGV